MMDNISENVKTSAEQAKELEDQALAKPERGTYTRVFSRPFTYQGRTFERMNFDWSVLTGEDSAKVKRELAQKRENVSVEVFSDNYLIAMAARACTNRDAGGMRTVSAATLEALPVCEYLRIRNGIRDFLLRAESEPTTEETGSENNA